MKQDAIFGEKVVLPPILSRLFSESVVGETSEPICLNKCSLALFFLEEGIFLIFFLPLLFETGEQDLKSTHKCLEYLSHEWSHSYAIGRNL